ncbi:MAG: hypothetical protein AUF76_10745 [Acidobacteria bacterium 13_1_20CM_2_65_9]|nr:MAG: hypothetical protein AUF76_10745 [Acidobacteria bacterium 13_1_20CM_2_65_9]
MATIRIEATYPHPPERVWKALTDPRAIAEWLMPNDFQPRLGHRFQFRVANAKGWSGVVDCEVTELSPPRLLSYSWKSDKIDTRVTWILQSEGAGTKLVLEHSGFQGVGGFLLRKLIMGPGWKGILKKKLPQVIERVASGGFVPDPALGGC